MAHRGVGGRVRTYESGYLLIQHAHRKIRINFDETTRSYRQPRSQRTRNKITPVDSLRAYASASQNQIDRLHVVLLFCPKHRHHQLLISTVRLAAKYTILLMEQVLT